MKLLLVEDEPLLQESLTKNLQQAGFLCDLAGNGEEASHLLNEFEYDCIILDLGLPKQPGLVVLEQFRIQNTHTPVLVLTARNAWQDRVIGLKTGADDYLGKPFHFEELLARVQNLIKRKTPDNSFNIVYKNFTLDGQMRSLKTASDTISLTKNEYRLLHLFFSHPNQIFSKDQLLQKISDQHSDTSGNLIEVYIAKLRRLLGKESIETLRGQGYRLVNLNPPEENA
ncbi:response regulator transcription factor [Thiosulfativibrio zosterae]|uniref:DNA-binding response regulator n=1 Tax=Thiosulfativibrio zosterae TaxID=2675053 RepID=A0A6F8PMM1_9GAMM|nr:response regulator transcription factor [Thiosulfativibrio zosterae]BBP43352.1 DNA-binding response regulator [Thiosulfativibrio zosterae]